MLVLRVRCVDDGRELLVERYGADEYRVQVAELKALVLQQRRQLHRSGGASNPSELQPADLEGCFVLLRGQILADPDVVDLNALSPSDFFVFAPDAPQSDSGSLSSSGMHTDQADAATFELLRSQLVDMGFPAELAAIALQQSGNNLLDAAASLAEGKVHVVTSNSESKDGEETKTTDLVSQHPSIAPLRSLVYDANVRKLRELAATDSFQALLLLKEKFPSEVLNKLNENPMATLRLLSLPAPAPSPTEADMMNFSEDVIDVDSVGATSSGLEGGIDRLVAMGFDRDLVLAMYDSCGGDEQLTANALLQTLES
ncbi:hypothetical protein PHYPSEUDO_001211 [Phytophthora pseudosyringae]|uniref:UBA domain-containing protein n=1 Tax=Phytophthora pseudosyringae TaxID=221518 RepID=A0A8T1W0D5_9STRA|nr:hypothetical protein PHYPSEUDO_001211 [Phytophthora pseudosyringae]